MLIDLRRYTTALRRLIVTVIYGLLVVVLTAITTRLIGYILCRSSDPHHEHPRDPGDDDVIGVTPAAQPATMSVSAQTRNFTVFDLRFSETKV